MAWWRFISAEQNGRLIMPGASPGRVSSAGRCSLRYCDARDAAPFGGDRPSAVACPVGESGGAGRRGGGSSSGQGRCGAEPGGLPPCVRLLWRAVAGR